MSLPVVGANKLHLNTLSPKVRKVLKHRADEAARRAYAPELRADRAAFGAVNRGYQEEASSVRGATQQVEKTLAQALQSAKSSGLEGPYLRELLHGISSKQGQAATAIPYLLADPARERREGITEARQELIGDRGAMQKTAAETFNQGLKEARGSAASVLKEEETAQREKGPTDAQTEADQKALANAAIAFRDSLHNWSKNPMVKEADGTEVPVQDVLPLKDQAEWRTFAVELDKHYSGFDLTTAEKVVDQYFKELQRKMHEGRLPQPGVPGPGRG
jgi:hypothetical protein